MSIPYYLNPLGIIKNTIDNEYLTFTAIEANSSVKLQKQGEPDQINLQYNKNNAGWASYNINQVIQLTNIGDKVQFKGTTTTFSKNENNYYKFVMIGKISASGNTDSLINYCALTPFCYGRMFSNCTSLATAPQLPATYLGFSCYEGMFYNCTSLTTAPALPATNLAYCCYKGMFSGCTSLTTAPALPATNLAILCYYEMFRDCTSLTTAPQLPATNLAVNCDYCYGSMFFGCKNLHYINVNLTSWGHVVPEWTELWVEGVSTNGTFVKPLSLPQERGGDYIPNYWRVVNK